MPRARFTVQEMVDLTLDFYRRNYIEGLFLSSGIIQSADYTTVLWSDAHSPADILPEATMIPKLLNSAHERTTAPRRAPSDAATARPFVPDSRSLAKLRAAVPDCRGCHLYARATQAVFGEGRVRARIVLVGEQPGDSEDKAGRPFVGPAGQVLDRALAEAGIDRDEVYVTNAVKHFSFEERGKRRIHKTPRASEVRACRPWLEAELHALRPACVVCLGSTAAQSLLGPQTRVMQSRGQVIRETAWAPSLIVTIHPSAVLRADDGESYYRMLVGDLGLAAGAVNQADSG